MHTEAYLKAPDMTEAEYLEKFQNFVGPMNGTPARVTPPRPGDNWQSEDPKTHYRLGRFEINRYHGKWIAWDARAQVSASFNRIGAAMDWCKARKEMLV